MEPDLYFSLKGNGVDLNDKYNWTRQTMMEKVCAVMGIKGTPEASLLPPQDRDDTYVLNVDNVTKIIAIKMRFR